MSNFIIAVNAVVPLFFFIAVGLLIKYRKLMTDTELSHFNKMLFQIFFFVMLFYTTYTTDLSATFRPKLMAYGAGVLLVMYAFVFTLVCCFEKSNKRRGAMIQAIYRSNFVFMGIPLVGNIYGEQQLGVTTMMIAVIVPLYNILGVVTLEIFRGRKFHLLAVVKGIFTNPMILGALFGFLFLLSGFKLPHAILKPLEQITAATSPLALMVLGASFHLSSTKSHLRQLIACVVSRLLLVPAATLGIAIYLGFRGIDLMTLTAIFCAPSAIASFTMAQQMDSDADLAGNCIVFSTAFSSITICSWILFFKSLGYI